MIPEKPWEDYTPYPGTPEFDAMADNPSAEAKPLPDAPREPNHSFLEKLPEQAAVAAYTWGNTYTAGASDALVDLFAATKTFSEYGTTDQNFDQLWKRYKQLSNSYIGTARTAQRNNPGVTRAVAAPAAAVRDIMLTSLAPGASTAARVGLGASLGIADAANMTHPDDSFDDYASSTLTSGALGAIGATKQVNQAVADAGSTLGQYASAAKNWGMNKAAGAKEAAIKTYAKYLDPEAWKLESSYGAQKMQQQSVDDARYINDLGAQTAKFPKRQKMIEAERLNAGNLKNQARESIKDVEFDESDLENTVIDAETQGRKRLGEGSTDTLAALLRKEFGLEKPAVTRTSERFSERFNPEGDVKVQRGSSSRTATDRQIVANRSSYRNDGTISSSSQTTTDITKEQGASSNPFNAERLHNLKRSLTQADPHSTQSKIIRDSIDETLRGPMDEVNRQLDMEGSRRTNQAINFQERYTRPSGPDDASWLHRLTRSAGAVAGGTVGASVGVSGGAMGALRGGRVGASLSDKAIDSATNALPRARQHYYKGIIKAYQVLPEMFGPAGEWIGRALEGSGPALPELFRQLDKDPEFKKTVKRLGLGDQADHYNSKTGYQSRQTQSNSDQIEVGNIDLTNRPKVKNGAGYSTVRSIGVNFDGQEVVIPTVSDDGRLLSDEEAIEQYRRTGKHLGKFKNQQAANKFAEQLHKDQEKLYGMRR